jgi:hypothetical protein
MTMPGYLLPIGAVVQCTHAAPATATPSAPRVFVSGQPVATVASLWSVTGCPFQIPAGATTVPQPCLRVQWAMPSGRILVGGSAALLQPGPGTGAGACLDAEQAPQGPPIVNQMQLRAAGS